MKVLAINCGSSSLKFRFMELGHEKPLPNIQRCYFSGIVDRIGGKSSIRFTSEEGEITDEYAEAPDHGEAVRRLFDWMNEKGLLGRDGLQAVGHRVVHGGPLFSSPAVIGDDTLREIENLRHLAPLHNKLALAAIYAARTMLGHSVPQVAVFDTAFHHDMPDRASMYAIPLQISEKHRIRRYGFHGLAHRSMAERYAVMMTTPVGKTRLVTLQLGNGCSAAAIDRGRSVDTSMGLTPLEGLIMGTRSGDVDPSLPGFLARHEGVDVEEVEGWLNNRSGILGISGYSSDMRELLCEEARGNAKAALAVEMFCYRARKYIGAYLAVLGGADAVIFGGGIGENSPQIRAHICSGMEWCGLIIDRGRNAAVAGAQGLISAENSKIHACVITVDEEAVIGSDTMRCLSGRNQCS